MTPFAEQEAFLRRKERRRDRGVFVASLLLGSAAFYPYVLYDQNYQDGMVVEDMILDPAKKVAQKGNEWVVAPVENTMRELFQG